MKKKHVIIGSGLLLFLVVIGVSFAWWTWSTSNEQNTNVVVTIGGMTINYEDGEDITNNNLIPTSTKEQGISKDITISSTGQVYLDLNITVVALADGLKDESFKYELYNDSNLVTVGNFLGSNVNDVINLLSGVEITSTPVTYTLYIWIDGNMDNPNTMYNQNFEFRLNANATDEKSASKQTLEKLGLTSNGMKSVVTDVATTDEGIYQAQDDYGTTYYFRGATQNNYVKFAGYYWRIVRINGDGSIRLIYDGTVAHANDESSDDRQIGTSAFNQNYDDNAYVGYMYGTPGSSAYAETHANINDSTIKAVVDNWYKTNIVDKGYSDKVADVIYCNDRNVYIGISWPDHDVLGYGKSKATYEPAKRILTWNNGFSSWKEVQQIKMVCTQKNDAFTVEDTSKGNGALTYPVGLLTVDEVLAGGGKAGIENSNYYLYTGQYYHTMSSYFFTGYARNIGVFYNGHIGDFDVYSAYAVRPVISLKSSIELIGNGTMEDPYVVQS